MARILDCRKCSCRVTQDNILVVAFCVCVCLCVFIFAVSLPVRNHRVRKYLWDNSKRYTATSLFTKGGSEVAGISNCLFVYRSESSCVCLCMCVHVSVRVISGG